MIVNRDELYEILDTLRKHKIRTILTAFGVFWGIFMLILLLASGDGLEKGVINRFKGIDVSSVHFYCKKTRIAYKGLQEIRTISFDNDDVPMLKEKFGKKIKYIGARSYLFRKSSVKYSNYIDDYKIYGVQPDNFNIRKVDILKGRYINPLDTSLKRNVVVIGEKVLNELFGSTNEVIGEFIKIENTFFKVIGIFKSYKEGEAGNNENLTLLIPNSSLQKNFDRVNKVNNISIVAKDEETENQILSFLKKKHKVHPRDRAIYAFNTRKEFSKFQGLFSGIRGFMWIVGVGTLLSGIVGVSNIMIINIKERTREIGIRKAIGAKPLAIIKMIIIESLMLTGISGYLGISVGLLLVEGINVYMTRFKLENEFFLNPEINVFVILTALTLLIIAGFLAAFFPARKAALIKPVDALKEN